MDKTQRQKLIEKLNSLESRLPIDKSKSYLDGLVSKESEKFQQQLKDNPTVQFLDEFNTKLEGLKKSFNLEPIITEIENLQQDLEQTKEAVSSEIQRLDLHGKAKSEEILGLKDKVKNELEQLTSSQISEIKAKISDLEATLGSQSSDSESKSKSLVQTVQNLDQRLNEVFKTVNETGLDHKNFRTSIDGTLKKNSESTAEEIKKVRQEFLSRISSFHGGGQANRNIAISGNTSVLSMFTDINIKPGNNITLSYQNNQTTKYLDLTIESSPGSAITRQIQTTTISSVIAGISRVDQVTLANGGVRITLPTAVGNTNLYTIKNIGTSSVLISTTGAQTIDNKSEIIMPVQYTSVDLISDSINWKIT